MDDNDDLATVAERACRAAGEYALSQFRAGRLDGEYGATDVKTDLDRAAERRALDVLEGAVPAHAIRAEESGRQPGEGYEWVVDPLDGTNNVAADLPVFASAVAALDDEGPAVAAVYEPLPDDCYLARRGAGAWLDGTPLRTEGGLAPERGTASLVLGLEAVRYDDLAATADRIEDALADRCKRVLSTWAPCVDWGLLARGGIEAIVTFHPDEWEHHAGTLLAREAGAARWIDGPLAVHAADEATLAAVRETVEPLV